MPFQMTEEVRLDSGGAARFRASAQSIGGFGRFYHLGGRFHLAEDARRGNHDLATAGNPGNVGSKGYRTTFSDNAH
jgi:hypothetical protein